MAYRVREMPESEPRYLLLYDYVEDVLERRAPYREAHLREIRAGLEDGRILMAGPLGDPPTGGAIVFADRDAAEAFVRADPYVSGGVVTHWRIERWTLI
jgi:uncharacterized protein YciI